MSLGSAVGRQPLLLPLPCLLAKHLILQDLPLRRKGPTPEPWHGCDDRSDIEKQARSFCGPELASGPEGGSRIFAFT